MLKSYVTLAEEVQKLLLRFPELVDRLREKDVQFIGRLERWLKEGEETLKNHGIAECARLAGFRSRLLTPLHGEDRRAAARKRQNQIAAEILFEVQDTLLEVYKPLEIRLNDARSIINQLLGAVLQTGSVHYDGGESFEVFVNRLWRLLTTHEQLKPAMVKARTLVSQFDLLRLLAEEINLEDWSNTNPRPA